MFRLRLTAALVCGAALLFASTWPVLAAQTEITSAGPLSRIIISDTLGCQVAHREDLAFEFYPPGSEQGNCGTFLALSGGVYGPDGGPATQITWAPVSQTPVTGTGSSGDPLRIATTVQVSEAALQVQQVDSYVVGSQSYRTDVQVTNTGAAIQTGTLYRAGDCFLQGNDEGLVRVDNGAPACIVDPALGRRIEQWTPITPGSHFFAGGYSEVWSLIASRQNFPDTCRCDPQVPFDNGAGLSWSLNIPPGESVVFSHETFFSPEGRGPAAEPFVQSVPDPTQISLDPVVIATSVAITAGVIVLVPFPSALFNNTLEANYAEVMAGVNRLRAWLARQFAAFRAWLRRKLDERRARQAAGAAGGQMPPPPPIPEQPTDLPPADLPTTDLPSPPPSNAAPILAQPLAEAHVPASESAPEGKSDVWRTPLGMLGFIALSALLYCFLDPSFGLSVGSLATYVGLAIGLVIALIAYGGPLVTFSRTNVLPLLVRALPVTLIVGLVCVLVSRWANFQPGYLYGLVIGFYFATAMSHQQEGKAMAGAIGTSLAVALVAWISLMFLRPDPTAAPDLVMATIQTAAVTVVVAGLENAVFGMLPVRFMPGGAIFAWDRRVWAALFAIGVFGFAHVLLNPQAGYLADSTRTEFLTMVGLLVIFGLVSVAFWAYFRYRPQAAVPPAT